MAATKKAPAKKAPARVPISAAAEIRALTERVEALEATNLRLVEIVTELSWYHAELAAYLRAQMVKSAAQQITPMLQQQVEQELAAQLSSGFGTPQMPQMQAAPAQPMRPPEMFVPRPK